jgi:hypothetical protein
MLDAANQSKAIATFLKAFDRLSPCTKNNVAHLIHGYILAESYEQSKRVRSLIAEQILKIDGLSPDFGVKVIPVLWQCGQEDVEDVPIIRPQHDQIDALKEFSNNLDGLVALLKAGEAVNVMEEFNSQCAMLPAGAKEMLLDVLAVVGEKLVDADTLMALIE